MDTPICSTKTLPPEEWVRAAEEASEINPANAPSLEMLREVAPIVRERAIAYFWDKLRWPPERVIHNVLTPLHRSRLMATAEPDAKSIMCYWLPGSIMRDGVPVTGGADISPQDERFVARLYPK